MYYFYIIKSKTNHSFYFGSTNDLRSRIKEHNDGKSKSTKRYQPWYLVYYEAYASEADARMREKQIKHQGKVYSQLKRRISKSLAY